ncbi:hypothetical protein IAD21_04322 [Abditibacteriota bacterium]|nr:hypothetical protein IAD21_04322 [Abditibacteriota bacterium]
MKRLVPLLILVAIGGGGYYFYRSQTAPRVNVVPFSKLSKPEQEKRRAEAQDVVRQVEGIARASKQGEKKPFEVTLSQEELNTLLQDRLKAKNLPIENPRVGLQNGQLVVEADANYKGVSAPVSIVGSVTAQNGDVAFTVDSLTLSVFSAPSDWKEKVQKAVDDGLKKALRDKGSAQIESVKIGDGTMTITGRTG